MNDALRIALPMTGMFLGLMAYYFSKSDAKINNIEKKLKELEQKITKLDEK